MANFGEWLRQQRRAVGLRRQEDLATLVNVTQPTISAWETGEAFPERERFQALAAALRTTEEEVFARAYDAVESSLREQGRTVRQMLELARRYELRFKSVASVLEAMTDNFDRLEGRLDGIQAELRLIRGEASAPPGRRSEGPPRPVHPWPQPEDRPRPRR